MFDLESFIVANHNISAAVFSVLSGVGGFLLGVKTKVISNRIKAKDEAVAAFIGLVDAEADFIRIGKREGAREDAFAMQALGSSYRRAVDSLPRRTRHSLQVEWERFQSQIPSKGEEVQGILGYRNHLTAHGILQSLSKQAREKWA